MFLRGTDWIFIYRQFNIQQFYVLPTQCIYVFCVDLRTNSDYFPIQHQLTGFFNRDGVCLLCGTDWIFIYRQFNIHNSTFCPHSVFMWFVWIWEQTAIISVHSITLNNQKDTTLNLLMKHHLSSIPPTFWPSSQGHFHYQQHSGIHFNAEVPLNIFKELILKIKII